MTWLFHVFCLLAATVFAAGAAPVPTPRPPLQVLEEMSVQLRTAQAAAQKEIQEASGHWQNDLNALTDSMLSCAKELTRAGMRSANPSSGFGLRILISNLHSARDPQQAVRAMDQLMETVSFLRIEHHLAAERLASAAPTMISHAKTREVLLEILHRPEFHQTNKPHFFDYYLNRAIVNAIAWLRRVFDSTAMQRAGRFAHILLWAVYVAVGGAVVWLVHRAWSPRRKLTEPEKQEASTGLALFPPEVHLAEAVALSQQGNFAAAARAYFLMMLATLEGRDLVPRNRSWTNWEYLRAFGKRVSDQSARGRLGQLNLVYDRMSYGGAACDESVFVSFRKDVDDFLTNLPAQSSVPFNRLMAPSGVEGPSPQS